MEHQEPPAPYSILYPGSQPPSPPECPLHRMTSEQLKPLTPSMQVHNKEQAHSKDLSDFCYKYPITVVHGLSTALEMNLSIFSSKTLTELDPKLKIDILTLNTKANRFWACDGYLSSSTIEKYAQYQALRFRNSLQAVSDSKDATNKTIKFASNIDLFDENKYHLQLAELDKLPDFSRVKSASNMLSYVGHHILGMNTVQAYMKVPGCRTAGHQENVNMCSVNINIGPGDCEWYAVSDMYWGGIQALCAKNGVNYLHQSWWPVLEDLYKANIPVYRFLQKPGDLVFVNIGCVHWVQAVGYCNNIAWNVGPLTTRQYRSAIVSYEWYKLQSYKNLVPMVHLSWNLARNIKVSDVKLFQLIKNCMLQTLTYVIQTLEFVKSKGVKIQFYGRPEKTTHYCDQCDVEVFNVILVEKKTRPRIIHCLDCALKKTPSLSGFMCLEEYELSELNQVYDAFVLCANTQLAAVMP